MKYILSLFFVATTLLASAQTKVGDVTVPATYKVGDNILTLNGAGMREKLWFDLYVGSLFVQQKTTSGSEVMNADAPMVVTLDITSSVITREKMVDAIMEGFEKSTKKNVGPYQKRIDQLLGAFSGDIVVGDKFALVYEPGKGVTLLKNGEAKTTVEGLDFKKVLFGIWLGADPVDDDLKEGMLGL